MKYCILFYSVAVYYVEHLRGRKMKLNAESIRANPNRKLLASSIMDFHRDF